MNSNLFLSQSLTTLAPIFTEGYVTSVVGPLITATGYGLAIGDIVSLHSATPNGNPITILAKVTALQNGNLRLTSFSHSPRIIEGTKLTSNNGQTSIMLGDCLLGTITNCLGSLLRPNNANAHNGHLEPLHTQPPDPLSRVSIGERFTTGIRAIDGLLTIGRGQRLGIFAEPGVGKSTLMATIANGCDADVIVFGLVGERGREVLDLADRALTAQTKQKTVITVATSNEPAIARITAAHTATRIAEYFRSQGKHVLLIIDSLTRLFRAYREVGLAAGEVPVRRGYPPSVFADLPDLIERPGCDSHGSMTALYTVLLSGDLDEDPMVEEIKGLTDGHIVLRKALAERNHFPAIDICSSLSRLMPHLLNGPNLASAQLLTRLLARLKNERDIVALGGRVDQELSFALSHEEQLTAFLQQDRNEYSPFTETISRLENLNALLTQT